MVKVIGTHILLGNLLVAQAILGDSFSKTEVAIPYAPKGVVLQVLTLPKPSSGQRPLRPYERSNYRLRWINNSSQSISIRLTHFDANYRLIIRDKKGNEPELSQIGKEAKKTLELNYTARDHNQLVTIKPGQSFNYDLFLDPATYYTLQSGRYALYVEYYEQAWNPMRLLSMEASIDVPPFR